MGEKPIPEDIQIKREKFLARWHAVVVTGFLGTGMQSDVYAIQKLHSAADRLKSTSALKVYTGEYSKSRPLVRRSFELHRLLKKHGIPTFDYLNAVRVRNKDSIQAGLEVPNLALDGAVVISSNSLTDLRHADADVLLQIAKVDLENLGRQIEQIARRCAYLGLAVATHVYMIVVQRDGSAEVIVGDLESFFTMPTEKALDYNLRDAKIVSTYPRIILEPTGEPTAATVIG